ncbi:hypothetical protein RB620_27700 [Paenibacillus sp. LHD-117]|uniref:hypothetical protein n=1 Tax=Paenibacillus sp. LHD-117 TaxID=3071412 RepID=UPI0027E0D42B|nr:hypothetical protein [Paenibacillus sp. LHD-117]MDQ6423219.1 hypothetical protein [Paenibacillus sp. LHD-117]
MSKRIRLILVVLILGVALGTAHRADALSCAPPGPASEELNESAVVFKGTAIAAKRSGLTAFRVERGWKGIESGRIELFDNGWDPFQLNKEYLVFGSMRDGELRMNLCGNTGVWDANRDKAMQQADVEPTVFGAASLVEEEPAQPRSLKLGIREASTILLFSIPVLALIVWMARRRRRSR